MEMLAMILFAVRDDCFSLAELIEHDDQLAAFDLLDLAGEQVANPAGKLVTNLGPFAFADALDDALLGSLDRGTSELGKIDGDFHLVANLEVRIFVARLFERNLTRRIGNFLDHRFQQDDSDLALVLVDVDFGLDGWSILLGESGVDAVLEQTVQFSSVAVLRLGEVADRCTAFSGSSSHV